MVDFCEHSDECSHSSSTLQRQSYAMGLSLSVSKIKATAGGSYSMGTSGSFNGGNVASVLS
jgi:hypothetical protein